MARNKDNGNKSQARPQSPISTSPVRSSPVPRAEAAPQAGRSFGGAAAQPGGARREPTADQIAKRAYEIWKSGKGGTDLENWIRAERELRGGS